MKLVLKTQLFLFEVIINVSTATVPTVGSMKHNNTLSKDIVLLAQNWHFY